MLIVGAFMTIAFASLGNMFINLMITCWYQSSYKKWYEREVIISENEAAKPKVEMLMQPGQQMVQQPVMTQQPAMVAQPVMVQQPVMAQQMPGQQVQMV